MRATESGAHVTGARQDALAATDGSRLNEVKKDAIDVSSRMVIASTRSVIYRSWRALNTCLSGFCPQDVGAHRATPGLFAKTVFQTVRFRRSCRPLREQVRSYEGNVYSLWE
ncbi:Unknown protein sequence [Pseudomonas syringae pv. syringae]|nr:Unknown protein sequence [Pseudomonas syringae pv. syringae]RMR48165.1 hypothetical protein ALP85_101977 [Pseudomonas syringae pv. syringae]